MYRNQQNTYRPSFQITRYIKPPHLRTPDAYINLDSGSDNDKPGPSSRVINIKRVQTKQPVTSQSSSTSYSTSSDESDISKRRYSRYGDFKYEVSRLLLLSYCSETLSDDTLLLKVRTAVANPKGNQHLNV